MTIRYLPLAEMDNRSALADMTYPFYRQLLQAAGPNTNVVGAVALNEGGPAGLGLAHLAMGGEPAHILSLFVAPSYRHQGVAGQLLERLTSQLSQLGEDVAVAVYPAGKESTPVVERLLAHQGFGTPKPSLYLYRAGRQSYATLLQASWMRKHSLPSGYEVFNWAEATAADHTIAREYENSPGFPGGTSAFQEVDKIDHEMSLGLREHGRLVGWLLAHRIAPDVVRQTCVYVHPGTAVKGLGVRLLAESFRRHIALADRRGEDLKASWGIKAANPMCAFFQRRIAPHLPGLSVTLTMECEKCLTRPAVASRIEDARAENTKAGMGIRYQLLAEVENRQALAGMTYPAFRSNLLGTGPNRTSMGVVANSDEGPCGLALAHPAVGNELAQVLSVFVVPQFRRQGIGGELLTRITTLLQERGEPRVVVSFPTGKEATPIVERMLARRGWTEPRPRLYLFAADKANVDALMQTGWMRERQMPPGYALFTWPEATEADRETAIEYENSPDFPHGLTPFLADYPIDPETSLGLRENGKLVGWMVTHRPGPEVLRYTCLYVHPSAAVKGVGIRMLIESLRRHAASPTRRENLKVVCAILAENEPMVEFFRHRFERSMPSLGMTFTVESVKELTGVSQPFSPEQRMEDGGSRIEDRPAILDPQSSESREPSTKEQPPVPTYVLSHSINVQVDGNGDLSAYSSVSRPLQKIDEIDLAIMRCFAHAKSLDEAAQVTLLTSLRPTLSREALQERVDKLAANAILRVGEGDASDVQQGTARLTPTRAGFATLASHHWMLRDYVRVSAYRSAIFKHAPGKRVLEIGCGSGILSIFASQAGAAQVTAIEETEVALLAQKMFAANGANVHLHLGNSLDLQFPERFDLIIHELFGVDPFFENVLKYLTDAKKRFLAPGGKLLPYRVDVCCVGVEAEYIPPVFERARLEAMEFETLYQVDFSPYTGLLAGMKEIDESPVPRRGSDFREALFTQPILTRECVLRSVNFTADLEADEVFIPQPADLEVTCDGRLGGILIYFRTYFDQGHALATSPFTPRTHWGWSQRDLSRVVGVRTGDKVPVVSEVVEAGGLQRLRVALQE
jgi:GNAT superfamily N-acetyltransferase/SAM-dependent methyltransferase